MSSQTGTAPSIVPEGFDLSVLKDFDLFNTDNIGESVTTVAIVFLVLVTVIVTLRIFVRLSVVRSVGIDDVLIILSSLFAIALSALCIFGVKIGIGKHIWNIAPFTEIVSAAKRVVLTLYFTQIVYSTAITLAKCSIMACYLRVFPNKMLRKTIYATAFVVISIWICSIFTTIFQCRPVEAAWNFDEPHKKCFKIMNFYYVSGSVNAVTDLLLCSAPLPLLWKIQVRKREKIIITVLFGFGYFASAASIVRLSFIYQLDSIDFSQQCVKSLIWSIIEVGIGIICASVPSLRPLVAKYLPSLPTRPSKVSQNKISRSDHFELSSCDRGTSTYDMGYHVQITSDKERQTDEIVTAIPAYKGPRIPTATQVRPADDSSEELFIETNR